MADALIAPEHTRFRTIDRAQMIILVYYSEERKYYGTTLLEVAKKLKINRILKIGNIGFDLTQNNRVVEEETC